MAGPSRLTVPFLRERLVEVLGFTLEGFYIGDCRDTCNEFAGGSSSLYDAMKCQRVREGNGGL